MRFIKIAALLVIIGSAYWFLEHEQQPIIQASGKKIKVGVIAPLTGMNMSRGRSGLKGIEIAMQLQPYLDNGDAIELVTIDDQGVPEQAITALKTLSETHKVAAILILSGSDSVLAVGKNADSFKTPVLALTASHPDITKHSSWVSQFNFDDKFQATVAALFIRDELLFDNVAILTQSDNAHFWYLAKEFSNQFTAVDGWVSDIIDLTGDGNNYVEILESIRSKGVDLLYLPVGVEHIFQIQKALEIIEWNPEIMASSGLMASVIEQQTYPLSLVDGMLATDTFHNDMDLTDFGERLKKKIISLGFTKQDIVTHSLLGMEGYALLASAMNQCEDSSNRDCINSRIRWTVRFEGIMGYITIDGDGKAHRPLIINELKDGKMNFKIKVY